jgi:CDP-alcohol phosphatidyltransferase
VKPLTELALKGRGVEEWVDIHFFRPVGIRVARALYPTAVSPDQVTVVCLLIGLLAGHLMVYRSVRLNALGLALFIVSDVFDSADGQLARIRGTSTRLGRILDGVADSGRFLNLYIHLMIRLMLAGWGPWAVLLVVAAGISHSLQSAAADFMRQAFLELGEGEGAELDLLGEEPNPQVGGFWRRAIMRGYHDYLTRQARMFATTVALIRHARSEGTTPDSRAAYRATQQAPVTWCALIAQNVRFLLLALTVVPGWPAGFMWLTIGPLNIAAVVLVATHERNATRLASVSDIPAAAQVA